MPFRCIGKCDQHGACTTGWIVHADIPLLFQLFFHILSGKLYLRHKPADVIGGKKLPLLFLLKVQGMVEAPQKILLRIFIQRQRNERHHLRKNLLFLRCISANDRKVLFFPFFPLRHRKHVCQGRRSQIQEIIPYLPSGIPAGMPVDETAELLLIISFFHVHNLFRICHIQEEAVYRFITICRYPSSSGRAFFFSASLLYSCMTRSPRRVLRRSHSVLWIAIATALLSPTIST